MLTAEEIIEKVKSDVSGKLEQSEDGQAIYAGGENVILLLKKLKEKLEYKMFADITASDYEDRFEVIYHLMDLNADIIKIKVRLSKNSPKIPTATMLWKGADVQEREIFDLMGIEFEGHNKLERILLSDEFEGHPLRKDFKLETVSRF